MSFSNHLLTYYITCCTASCSRYNGKAFLEAARFLLGSCHFRWFTKANLESGKRSHAIHFNSCLDVSRFSVCVMATCTKGFSSVSQSEHPRCCTSMFPKFRDQSPKVERCYIQNPSPATLVDTALDFSLDICLFRELLRASDSELSLGRMISQEEHLVFKMAISCLGVSVCKSYELFAVA